MTDSEVYNFANQTIHELDASGINGPDFQYPLALTIPRLQALKQILTFYVYHHTPEITDNQG